MFFESILNKYKKYVISTGVVGLVTAGMTTPAHAQQTDEIVEFDIPAQKLSNALKSYGVAADRQVLFAVNLVRGKQANAVSGELQPNAALDKLLIGSGLAYETTVSDVVVIKAVQQDTSVGQTLRVASVDEDDVGGVTVSEDEGDVLQQLEEIIVTGTNIRGVQNPTTLVLEFDREDIDLSGAATVEDFLRTIPQNFAGNAPIAGDSANPNGSPLGNALQRTAVDIRGVGAGATLTLLNGRRMTASGTGSFVDVSILPLGAIERVDVQTDGASAVYGTDAVGGVVNFITRKDFDGFEVNGRYGTVTDGSREEFKIGAAGGRIWGGGSGFVGVEYLDHTPLLVSEREFVDTTIASPEGAFGPSSEKLSVVGSAYQSLTEKFATGIDFLYSQNESQILQNTARQREFRSRQEVYYVNARFTYELLEDIAADLFVDYGREETKTRDNTDNFTNEYGNDNDTLVFEGKLSGSIDLFSDESISFALGGAYREENISDLGGDERYTREVTGGYGELLISLISEAQSIPLVQEFQLSIAGRYEDYSDFGDTFNPKIGAYWEIADGLSLRGAYSESFRAPTLFTLSNEVFVQVRALPTSFYMAAVEALPEQDPRIPDNTFILAFTGGGNPLLTEETARTWTGGIEWKPVFVEGLSLMASYYRIAYKDRVESVPLFDPLFLPEFAEFWDVPPDLAEVQAFFAAAKKNDGGFQNRLDFDPVPEDIQVLANTGHQNLAERNVEGIDITASYDKSTRYGDFSAGLNLAYMFEFEVRPTSLADSVDQVGTAYRPIDLQLRGNVSWSRNGFTTFLAVNHKDSYQSVPDSTAAVPIESWTTVDLALTYNTEDRFSHRVLDDVQLSFNVRNLLDEDPPFFFQPLDGLNFDTANADPFGRFLSFAVSKQF